MELFSFQNPSTFSLVASLTNTRAGMVESLRCPGKFARQSTIWTSVDFVRLYISIRWVDAGPFPRLHPHEIGSSVRKAARPRVCTHVRAVPRDSSPYGINQVKKTCRKVLTLGSAHPACFVPLLASRAERVKLPLPPPPLSRVPGTPCTPKGSSRLDLPDWRARDPALLATKVD